MGKYQFKRRIHKERSQPTSRARHGAGFLEKHKDYVERARVFKRKREQILSLKRKAADRNADEFAFGMMRSRMADGKWESTEAPRRWTEAELRLMRDQDESYLTMRREIDRRRAERIRASLHGLSAPAANKHVVFMESADDVQKFDAAEYFDTAPELVNSRVRPHLSQLREEKLVQGKQTPKDAKVRMRAYAEAEQREKRAEKLGEMCHDMSLRRKLSAHSAAKKVDADGKVFFRWPLQRSK
eukprot:m51a1_g2500 hypothetical protein (242) ;mRNA; r:124837-125650